MGSYKGSFKGLFKGIYRGSITVWGLGPTWRFMGSGKWGYKYLIPATLLIAPLIITHEPPSRA